MDAADGGNGNGMTTAASANVLSQVSSLVSLQFLAPSSASAEDGLDQPKYKCTVSLAFVDQLARQVDFEVHRYLYDFS